MIETSFRFMLLFSKTRDRPSGSCHLQSTRLCPAARVSSGKLDEMGAIVFTAIQSNNSPTG
ncbi:hypothetical protein [Leptothermofonsia sp. ETS-13]|uniref:hypothetical protein n=1 Tax=Leptothermofonsia sp. ETS-13 TaxID=3035696 RepID=UPI003BA349CE